MNRAGLPPLRQFLSPHRKLTMRPGKTESSMQKLFSKHALLAGLAGALVIVAASPSFARHPRNPNAMNRNTAAEAYAYEPRQDHTGAVTHQGQCWIATDYIRGFGYSGACANPLAQNPSLDPTYNPLW
jgi:hypothetical protein